MKQRESGQREYLRRRDIVYTWRARHGFLVMAGPGAWARRHREILALPRKTWHGRRVLAITCDICGKVRWNGEYVYWHLMSLGRFQCEWCR